MARDSCRRAIEGHDDRLFAEHASVSAHGCCFRMLQGDGQQEEGKEKIAMTSPVTAEMGDDGYKVGIK